MAWLNPYDELYYRIVVGRLSSYMNSKLAPDVFSYRLQNDHPAWRIQDTNYAFNLRKERGKELLSKPTCKALGTGDVRNYFPSLSPEIILRCLIEEIDAANDILVILDFLGQLLEVGAPPGLPMGPEASGLIGNFLLIGVDLAVDRHTLGHVRFMDDSWFFLESEENWSEVKDIYSSAVNKLELDVNEAKMKLYYKHLGEAFNVMEEDLITYVTSEYTGYFAPERAAEEIRDQIQSADPQWHIIRFFLGMLRSRRNPLALKIVYDNPRLLWEEPRAVGRYLLSLTQDKEIRATIDRDWIVENATKRPEARTLAGQMQICRVASRLRLSKRHGKCIEEVACSENMHGNSPLQSWMFKAWGASEAFRPDRAVSYANHFGDFSVRRSLALTIHSDSSTSSKFATWHRKLKSVEPDLEPMLVSLTS